MNHLGLARRTGTNVWYVDSDGNRVSVYHDPNEPALPRYRIAGRWHVREDLLSEVRQ